MSTLQQQVLNLPQPTTYDEPDFFVSSCNRMAYQWILEWPNWPSHCTVFYGPIGSGKTHLAHIWARRAGAIFLKLEDLASHNLDILCQKNPHIILEDIPREFDQESLFHLYNTTKQLGGFLFITSSWSPNEWKMSLPDLSSRMRASSWIEIESADEELSNAMMFKLMADKQIMIPQRALNYLFATQDRSFASLQKAVEKINTYALSTKRKITLPLVKEALRED